MNTQVVGLEEQSKAMAFAEQSAAILKQLRILDEDFNPAQVTSIDDFVANMGDRLYVHAYDFHHGRIERDDDYAQLFCALLQHAGLVEEFTEVESYLDRESGIAHLHCVSGPVAFSSQWKQTGNRVEEEFFSFANAALDGAGEKMHVRLPSQDQTVSMICVDTQHFKALDAMLRAVEVFDTHTNRG